MLRLGVVGTGPISASFIEASADVFDCVAIASRSPERAKKLAAQTGLQAAHTATVAQLLTHQIDLIYLASPNSLHASQALEAIAAGVHVIVEKPAFWNPSQWEQVHQAADQAGVLVLEAARHMYEPGFVAFIDAAQELEPVSASFTFAQYSSRWDAVCAGEVPNIFSLDFGGGALVDLGVYAVYTAVSCFGAPSGVHYSATLAPSGVDAHGTLVLVYPTFDVTIRVAKDYAADTPAEIYAGRQRLIANGVQDVRRVELVGPDHTAILYDSAGDSPRSMPELMRGEAQYFASLIQAYRRGDFVEEFGAQYQKLTEISRCVNEVCTRARHSAGIFFTGEVSR